MPASAIEDAIHDKCIKAADYKGCVEAMSGNVQLQNTNFDQLIKALKRLPSRLNNTSLRDFTSNTQFFNDAIADLEFDELQTDYEKFVLQEAQKINEMMNALQSAWSDRINDGTYYGTYSTSYYCSVLEEGFHQFNSVAGYGSPYEITFSSTKTKKGLLSLGLDKCSPQEYKMIQSIERRVANALVSPEERQAKIDKEKREAELCAMAPWQRYLEENPGIKAWAKANPEPAKAQKQKFLADPKNGVSCSVKSPSPHSTNIDKKLNSAPYSSLYY